MRTPASASRRMAQVLAGLAAATTLLSGCSNMATTASDIETLHTGSIAGKVHGGNQPVSGATVKLYAIGATGYGSAGTLLATTTSASDGYGSFNFSQVASGGAGPSGNSYTCPTSTTQLYVIANGGNTVGSGTNNNTAAAFIAAAGPCAASASEYLDLNEITTVATVYALAQYINPGSAPGSESIGISGTALAATGYANAYATIANMANITTGATVTPPTYTGANSAAGVTVTATAESSKLITIADILASCVNNASASNNNCADLFASASAPTASQTSQPSATFSTAQDTVQAAYYLATNPANNGTFSTCNNGGTTKTGCLYGLVTASGAPFQPALSTAPTDWTLGVTFSASGACPGGGNFIAAAYHAAIDATGNIWFINGAATNSNLSEISPVGQPLLCYGDLPAGRGLTIDANGNIWASFNGTGTTTAGAVIEIPAGSPTATPLTATSPSTNPYTLAADGFGNVFLNLNATGGSLYEYVNPGTQVTTTPTQIALNFNGSTATTTLGYLAVDPLGRIWDSTSTVDFLYEIYPKSVATITGVSISGGTVTFTGANSFSTGQVVQVSGLTSSAGTPFDNATLTLTAASGTSFSATTTAANTSGTISDAGTAIQTASYSQTSFAVTEPAYGMAIDSNNYLYQGTTCCGSGAPYREALKWTPGAGVQAATATNTYSSVDFGGINGIRAVVVDGAANFWLGNELPTSAGSTATTGQYGVVELSATGSGAGVTFSTISTPGLATEPPPACSTSAGCATQGGYFDPDFLYPQDLEVDLSGNLWVMNTGYYETSTTNGTTITELVGAAVPVVAPTSIAVRNNTLATKP